MSITVCSNLHDFKDVKGTNDIPDDIVRESFLYTKMTYQRGKILKQER